MANLVSPGYNRNALVNEILAPEEERVIEFKGLNRRPVVEEGEMSAMKNLTSDNYPMLTPRKLRGEMELPEGVVLPLKIMARYDRIALIAKDDEDNINFYYDGEKVDDVTGLTADTQMVAINTKICFFTGSRKTYLELVSNGTSVTTGAYGNLEASETLSGVTVTLSNEDCRFDVPANHGFGYDDAIDIHITSYTPSGGSATSTDFKISCIIEEVVNDNTLVLPRETFIEMTGEGVTSFTMTGTVKREIHDMDMVLEWNNRLWGASSEENMIYACKLGDPKNWKYYQGTALDSYYAQQGTDGAWTGCAAYSNHIIFFKQGCMTRIYGSSPATFQSSNVQCFGVETGSERSVVVVNDRVFYKSVIGIMCYEGGTPYCISDKFNIEFRNVVGATEGNKYYASVQSPIDGYPLLVLDIDRGVWHMEDRARMIDACAINHRLYFINHEGESIKCGEPEAITSKWLPVGHGAPSDGKVLIVNPDNATETYEEMDWMATFGPFDEYIENRKIYSKILMRLVRSTDSEVKVFISTNEGPWEQVYDFSPAKTGGDYIPIIPRRCDRYSIKVEGIGNCSIKSLTRRVRRGTGGRL